MALRLSLQAQGSLLVGAVGVWKAVGGRTQETGEGAEGPDAAVVASR